jgi:hypothetical protein
VRLPDSRRISSSSSTTKFHDHVDAGSEAEEELVEGHRLGHTAREAIAEEPVDDVGLGEPVSSAARTIEHRLQVRDVVPGYYPSNRTNARSVPWP